MNINNSVVIKKPIICLEDFLLPYATIRSEYCESNDMKPILIKEECFNVTGFFSKLEFNSGYDYNGQRQTWGLQDVYNLNVPFGCFCRIMSFCSSEIAKLGPKGYF